MLKVDNRKKNVYDQLVRAAIHCRQLVCQGDMGVNTDYTALHS